MNIILLHGNHSFARKRAKRDIVAKLTKNNKIVSVSSFSVSPGLNPKNIVFQQILQRLTEDSLFAQNEIVAVNLLPKNKPTRGKYNADVKFLLPLLSKIPANITLIVDASAELSKSSELLTEIKKLKGDVQLFKLPPVKDKSALYAEVKKFLTEEKVIIDGYLVQKLIDDSRGDWWYVISALEQAVLLSRSRDTRISAEEISSLWDLQEEQSIFRLFDAIGNGDKVAALKLLYESNSKGSLKTGTDVERALGLISLLARQIKQLVAVKGNLTSAEAQKDWQIPVFAFSKLKHQASYFSLVHLSEAYEKLAELQEKAKRGLYSPLSLVEFFILYLISHRNSGDRAI